MLCMVNARDDELPIWLDKLVDQTNSIISSVVPGSARITVGNLYTRTKGDSER
jgi:hypothetical protein